MFNSQPYHIRLRPAYHAYVLAFAFAEVICSPSVSATCSYQQPVPG
jgi:hypothetical protein